MFVPARLLFALGHKPEEARSRPMRSCDLPGDCGEGWIAGAGINEPVFRHRDGMGPATPLADQAGAGFQGEAGSWADPSRSAQGFGQRLQFTDCRLAEAAMLDLLTPVGNAQRQEITADFRWTTFI